MPAFFISLLLPLALVFTAWAQKPPHTMPHADLSQKPKNPKTPQLRPKLDTKIERLEKMSPADRERTLAALPPERRAKIENRLERLQNLSPQQRSELQERLERFKQLPPETQRQIRQLAQQLQALPEENRKKVRREIRGLRAMPEEQRLERMKSPEFQKHYSPEEQQIIRQSATLLPEPF